MLPLVLIMLVLGSTILVGTLAYASTSLNTGRITKNRADQLYAADAGVRWAIWKMTNDTLNIPTIPGESMQYAAPEVNGKTVNVNIDCVGNLSFNMSYRITSTATDQDPDGSATTVEVYTRKGLGLWDFAAASAEGIEVFPNCNAAAASAVVIEGPTIPEVCNENSEPWPDDEWPFDPISIEEFKEYFKLGFDSDPVEENEWLVNDQPIKDDWYVEPPKFEGKNKVQIINKSTSAITAKLGSGESPSEENPEGEWSTVYVENETESAILQIGASMAQNPDSHQFTLDLNRNTIFVEGSIDIGSQCTITNSGCIIATGDISFGPNMDSGPGDFVFVLSLYGTVDFSPNGEFYGSIAGRHIVSMLPGVYVKHTDPPEEGLNFPLDTGAVSTDWSILTWKVERASAIGLMVRTTSLMDGEVGEPYIQTLSAANGSGTYNWTVTNGNLPPGLTMDSAGNITGNPNADGPYNFTVTVTDTDDGATASKELSVTIHPAVSISTPSQYELPDATVDEAYTQEFVATGGITPFSWAITSGSLPDGTTSISYNPDSHVAGINFTPLTPSADQDFVFRVTVYDSLNVSDYRDFLVHVNPAIPP